MKRYLKLLSTSVSAALAGAVSSYADEAPPGADTLGHVDTSFGNIPVKQGLNTRIPLTLAAHGSHRSHGSHGSHRSSSGGAARPAPRYSSPVPATPAPRVYPAPEKQSDPLGQRAKPQDTYNPSIPDASKLAADKELRKRVILQVQMKLTISGEYDGNIDGIMGPATRDAIDIYKIKKGLKRGGYLDLETLNALGINAN